MANKLAFKIDLTGRTFNRWFVIKHYGVKIQGTQRRQFWLCRCICGVERAIYSASLLSGRSKSCGCLLIEIAKKVNTTHGFIADSDRTRKFWQIWNAMRQRCANPKDRNYHHYGGRGITVCNRWLESFENFRDDMYLSYLEHGKEFGFGHNTSLDRFPNNDGNYELSNCRWATSSEQNRHTRNSANTTDYAEHFKWLKIIIRTIYQYIHSPEQQSKYEKYFGCDVPKFRQHIESQFTEGMTWDNHGSGFGKWQVDHIIGCNNFDLSKEEDRLICFNYINLRPMWDKDHRKKSTRRLAKEKKLI